MCTNLQHSEGIYIYMCVLACDITVSTEVQTPKLLKELRLNFCVGILTQQLTRQF